jgi:folylpolyglutamate synthase/dihydropteroate synthase
LAFHIFQEEKARSLGAPVSFSLTQQSYKQVDVSIFEVGIGGRLDSTNVIPRPLVTGVTALGLDHVAILGKTIEAIAEQKGGIFKVR